MSVTHCSHLKRKTKPTSVYHMYSSKLEEQNSYFLKHSDFLLAIVLSDSRGKENSTQVKSQVGTSGKNGESI